MANTRRNILALLGVAPLGTAALAAETLSDPNAAGDMANAPAAVMPSVKHQLRVASALENLAKAIRSGEAQAGGLDIASSVQLRDWIEHKVTVTVELPGNWTPLPPATS